MNGIVSTTAQITIKEASGYVPLGAIVSFFAGVENPNLYISISESQQLPTDELFQHLEG